MFICFFWVSGNGSFFYDANVSSKVIWILIQDWKMVPNLITSICVTYGISKLNGQHWYVRLLNLNNLISKMYWAILVCTQAPYAISDNAAKVNTLSWNLNRTFCKWITTKTIHWHEISLIPAKLLVLNHQMYWWHK